MSVSERGDLDEQPGSPRTDEDPRKKAKRQPATPPQGPREARPRKHDTRS